MNKTTQGRLKLCLALLLLGPAASPCVSAATTPDESGLSSNELLRKAYDKICTGSFDEAMPTLCQVVRTDRNSPTARRYLAFVLLQGGHAREALSQLDALSRIQPEGYTFDILLQGVANDMIGEHEKALAFFQQAVAREPQSDYYRIKLVDELITLQRYEEAEKLATDGYNASKDAKITAVYHQKIKKIQSTLRLTGHTRTAEAHK